MKLKELYLSDNQINDVTPLCKFPKNLHLRQLHLENNNISDISTFSSFTQYTLFQYLGLSGNKIEDWKPIKHLPEFMPSITDMIEQSKRYELEGK
jgi:Leucine-rich repeat (LRR) protein